MRPFSQVDVFSPQPLRGNPVAVVHEAKGLLTEQMLRFTRWTNLSEATFLLPPRDPTADYRVRIFTQAGELPFVGHPTLGTCHAWLAAGGVAADPDHIVQECDAGLVPIRRSRDILAFRAPPLVRYGPVSRTDLARFAAILGIGIDDIVDSSWADNGPGWVALLLRSAEAVLKLRPQSRADHQVDIGVVGPYPAGSECAYEVRAFFSNDRGDILEDPVTGSLNASLAQWLVETGVVTPPYVASQGTALGRGARPRISQADDGSIWIGGATHTLVEGCVRIE